MAQISTEVIPLSRIRPSLHQLHKEKSEIEELKRSITTAGLLHPIIVRPINNHYEIIAGNRRYNAVLELGWKELRVGSDVKVVVADDKHAFEMALIENMARKDIEAMEEGKAFHLYCTEHGWGSMSELAEKINKSVSHVSQRIDLYLKMPEETFQRLKSAGLSDAHTIEIATSKLDGQQATDFADALITTGLDRDDTRKAIGWAEQGWAPSKAIERVLDFPEKAPPKQGSKRDPMEELREDMENILSQALTKMDKCINDMPEGEEHAKWIGLVRSPLHDLKSACIKIRKEYRKHER